VRIALERKEDALSLVSGRTATVVMGDAKDFSEEIRKLSRN
jgi:hypothetical protein